MLKLTTPRPRNAVVYVDPAHLALIEPDGVGGSYLWLSSPQRPNFQVCESPKEIMAMPAMLRHCNPLMPAGITDPSHDMSWDPKPDEGFVVLKDLVEKVLRDLGYDTKPTGKT
jgi:hypothetical protein